MTFYWWVVTSEGRIRAGSVPSCEVAQTSHGSVSYKWGPTYIIPRRSIIYLPTADVSIPVPLRGRRRVMAIGWSLGIIGFSGSNLIPSTIRLITRPVLRSSFLVLRFPGLPIRFPLPFPGCSAIARN